MSSCVLFAAGVNADDKLYVLREYVEMLQQNFSDCDIYAGINFGAHSSTESILEDAGLQITYERLEDESFHVTAMHHHFS